MSFERWGYQFDGAYASPDPLKSVSGVYVVWCKTGNNWTVLDVGEAGDVKARISNHDRADCWSRNCSGTIYYSATYTPGMGEEQRRQVERKIRSLAIPPCGEA